MADARCATPGLTYVFSCWSGVAVVDGKLVEVLHVDEAQRTLALQGNIQALQVRHGGRQRGTLAGSHV